VTQLISSANTNNTLSVTEDDFTSKGAPMSLVIQEKRLKFMIMISKKGIEKAGIKVSSSLLSLGEQV
jgi:hypothetical protein